MGLGRRAVLFMCAGGDRLRSARGLRCRTIRIHHGGARTLPSFLIVGAQRCGTNSLYQFLADHPGVARALARAGGPLLRRRLHHGLDWYRGHFPTRHRMEARGAAGVPAITGESSPYYLFHPLAPERIARTLPAVKLIVLLRHPVDRAFSHYQHARARGTKRSRSRKRLAANPARLAGEHRADHQPQPSAMRAMTIGIVPT